MGICRTTQKSPSGYTPTPTHSERPCGLGAGSARRLPSRAGAKWPLTSPLEFAFGELGDDLQPCADGLDVGAKAGDADVGPLLHLGDRGLADLQRLCKILLCQCPGAAQFMQRRAASSIPPSKLAAGGHIVLLAFGERVACLLMG